MKLAEALVNRADCQKRVEQLRQRLVRSAKAQEGETPPENPTELLVELERTLGELSNLIKYINQTNSVTTFREGAALSDALAERDILALKRSVLGSVVEAAATPHVRLGRAEIKFFSTINVMDTQKQVDDLAKQYRELDSRIQVINWQTELIEG
jgi:uncharacterized protein DUF6847